MITVLVVDDHAMVREGLASVLAADGDIEVVGAAANGADAVVLVAEHTPDVVVMDLSMPVMDGVAATRAVREAVPGTRAPLGTKVPSTWGPSSLVHSGKRRASRPQPRVSIRQLRAVSRASADSTRYVRA